ncbi:SUMF1/EgtB/PvdO family nonheme iron enzyme [Rubellicoccus peritrichatus]|uniref:SUMF1/EgtB/PvdO family nonheme iron enzyme n=1 Tax=Rubellicoccus peritrichatus TaxID=3080537 RepID=A0AAQ3QUZ4_9BACT|nr:SUMF1/EgtB/PvdO family nonheme iron enzyme [Puniceicoccus sp. CR14]WOO40968.1 SUMF1/EgtB/PvdO family nonheme iron enzyme [Puniceicoccus sp. CR14]
MSDGDKQPAQKPPPGRAYEVLTPGEKFGDYQILKCLSYDLMGSFYRVRRARETEERTIFVLPPLVGDDASFRGRFDWTCAQLKEMEHESIFAVRDAGVVKERFTLFSDDFDGQNIADYLEAHAREKAKANSNEHDDELLADQQVGLPQEEVKQIVRSVVEALVYAHEHKVLHLNLNPTNILRAKDGTIKVTGFGLMNMAGKTLFEALVSAGIPPISLGPRRIRINTVDILSPETRLGKKGDQRSDIYALGLTAYWLLTGRKPVFDYEPPSNFVEGLEPGWDMLIAKCLERDPNKRYQSAAAVVRDLNRLSQLHLSPVPEEAGTKETRNILKHIDFIPVPKKIKAKGTVYARAFRLGVIGVFSIVLSSIITSFYNVVFSDELGGEGPVAVKVEGDKTPRLSIMVAPKNASIQFAKENLTFITRDGKLPLNVLPGNYRLVIKSPKHVTTKKLIEVGDEPQTLAIKLKPDWATVDITTVPGAIVTATDKEGVSYNLGAADAEGKLRITEQLYSGVYTLNLTKDAYKPFIQEGFEITGGQDVIEANFPLEPIPGTLRVRSKPTGADIIVDGEIIGQTNFTAEDLPVMEEFFVALQKPGYRKKILAVELKPSTRTILDFGDLVQMSGTLIPALTFDGQPATKEQMDETQFVVEAKSEWWDEKMAYSGAMAKGNTMTFENVPIGKITLTIKHPEYSTLERQFDLPDQARFKLPLNMTAKPAVITISPHPANLALRLIVNGRNRELTDKRQFAVKPNQTYELQLEAPEHIPVKRTVKLEPNEKFTWDATLQPFPGPAEGESFTIPYTGEVRINPVPAGSFTMGSPLQEPSRLPEEGPQTQVEISKPFWISTHEITQAQYKAVTKDNPSNFKSDDRPVDSVTWRDAMKFAKAINQREAKGGRVPEGYEYRLPTEAEWEYAARAGSDSPFHWGDTANNTRANFKGEYPRDFTSSELDESEVYGSVPVGNFEPNAYGLYDMHGNVREWTLDYFNGRLPGGIQTDWLQPMSNSRRVVRGGGWEDFAIRSRSASRGDGQRENTKSSATGIRLVLAPKLNLPK